MHALGTYRRYNSRRRKFTSPSFYISDEARLRHLWVIGKTGMGKSTFLANSLIEDIRAGAGCALFDPHGDLAEEILSYVPPWRRNDVIYFNPADIEYPIGFNPLANVEPDRRPLVVSTVVDALHSIWPDSWGPQLQMFLEATCGALLEMPGATLPGINLMLTDAKFRAHVLRHVKDVGVRSFWERDFALMPDRERRERSLSTLNKVGQFLSDFRLRNIVGQPRSGFDIDDIMANRKVFIANLAQGELGVGKSKLLGALLIVCFHLAALRRQDRTPFHIAIDEFHTFGASTFAEMLSGIRKYGVSLTLAHQYLDQLPESLRAAIIGTVGNIVAFRVGARDAEALAPEFSLKPDDFTGLSAHTAQVRTGERTIVLSMPALSAKRCPSGPRRVVNRCHNELAMMRADVTESIQRQMAWHS
jgi:type IV secretory pathway TraG/TraD family ATPase VirD4